MLTDRGILQRRGRAWQIATDGDIPVPDTVQALIAARMDTLSPNGRRCCTTRLWSGACSGPAPWRPWGRQSATTW